MELIGPKNSINFVIALISHGLGLTRCFSSTLSLGIATWDTSYEEVIQ